MMADCTMAWMRMPGQTWSALAVSFVCMWTGMMVVMMLPSLVPMLRRYRRAVVQKSDTRLGDLTAIVAIGYFAVWVLLGIAIFPVGAVLATLTSQHPALSHAMPGVAAASVLGAGALQLTGWKSRQLVRCRALGSQTLAGDPRTAWRHGVALGLQCNACCASLTLVLLAIGVMSPSAMMAVTVAITAERLLPAGQWIARASGAAIMVAGACLLVAA